MGEPGNTNSCYFMFMLVGVILVSCGFSWARLWVKRDLGAFKGNVENIRKDYLRLFWLIHSGFPWLPLVPLVGIKWWAKVVSS